MFDPYRCPHCGTYAPWTEPDPSRCRECGRSLDAPPAEAEAPESAEARVRRVAEMLSKALVPGSCTAEEAREARGWVADRSGPGTPEEAPASSPEAPPCPEAGCMFPACRPEFHPGECGRFGIGATASPASSPEARTIAERLAEIREDAPDAPPGPDDVTDRGESVSARIAAYDLLAREADRTRPPDVEPGALIRAVEAMTPEDRSRLRAALDPEAEAIRPVLVRAAALAADRLGPLVRRFREATGGRPD